MSQVQIFHRPTGILLAEGPLGWGITRFEGNYYIQRKYLKSQDLHCNYIPGICIYKFFYIWLDLHLPSGERSRYLGWRYWLPNPLMPFIWFRVALPGNHAEIEVRQLD